jgi:HSP20 family protein
MRRCQKLNTESIQEEVYRVSLTPYEPFGALEHWRRDLDRFFNDFPASLRPGSGFPRMDVYETKEVVVHCEIPGVEKKEDIHIDVNGDRLTVGGVYHSSRELKEAQMHRRERFEGRFQRSVTLPAQVKNEGITASYKNGLLEIHLPKQEPGSNNRIDIEFH